jgi:hypothetical protein
MLFLASWHFEHRQTALCTSGSLPATDSMKGRRIIIIKSGNFLTAARAYDAAVWQLKPYEVAKAYVNFKDECPTTASPARKSANCAQGSPARAASTSAAPGSPGQLVVAPGASRSRLPNLQQSGYPCTACAAWPGCAQELSRLCCIAAAPPSSNPALPQLRTLPVRSRRSSLARAETAPCAAALSLARAGSSDHDLSGVRRADNSRCPAVKPPTDQENGTHDDSALAAVIVE